LISRNDVGFDAARLSDSATDFHAKMQRRHAGFPRSMLATATHDHKRGEDVRARLAVLSECATDWSSAVTRWIAQCRNSQISARDLAILFQMIVGAWPLDLDVRDREGRRAFATRLAQWQQKALREAKLETDWSVPNEAYEAAAHDFLISLIVNNEHPALLNEIAALADRIAPAGAVNGIAQVLLKLTAPGIPDIYQGTELWDFSLVDPDNRRPVDFALRANSLSPDVSPLAANWRDGRLKQALITRVLAVRRQNPELFTEGSYEPLGVSGEHADRIIAFARRAGSSAAITVAPRAASRLLSTQKIVFESTSWGDTAVALQHELPLADAFGAMKIAFTTTSLPIAKLFSGLPLTFLVSPDLAP
jgi:(1->4)-alpha-D-glucan 1-alpha-D-glucosylmutase